jgi:hypothetical protein
MTDLLIVALGACVGAVAAGSWFARRDSKWFVVASNSVVCTLMGAFVALPEPPRAVTLFIEFGVLTTAATPLSLLRPLPVLREFSDVWRVARHMAVWLTTTTFYCAVFVIVGYASVSAAKTMLDKPIGAVLSERPAVPGRSAAAMVSWPAAQPAEFAQAVEVIAMDRCRVRLCCCGIPGH